jgi:2-oxo-4-hydroxy-4-carboxy-5-ureidoimidazoline decarboxylase
VTLPAIAELDALDESAFVRALAALFENAPRYLHRLARDRPFGSYEALFAHAEELALGMPEDEAIDLLDRHPRIGARPGGMSALSRREQGYADDTDGRADGEADDAAARLQERLDDLNERYERRFGFRFVVFVAGRPREAIVPLLEGALRADRDAELERGLRDVVAIARDRARKLGVEEAG